MTIDIKGIDKAELLQGLFNRSKPQGLGFFAAGSNSKMSKSEAQDIVAKGNLRFDYLSGHAMKINISGDEMDPCQYDLNNGPGAALSVVKSIKQRMGVEFKKGTPQTPQKKFAAEEKIAAEEQMQDAFAAQPLKMRPLKK